MNKSKVKFYGFRKLKTGDYRGRFDLDQELKTSLYNQALKENVITLEELKYQALNNDNAPFKDLVIAAQLLRGMQELVERTVKDGQKTKRKGQKAV